MNLEQIVLRVSRHPHSPLFARLANEYLNSGRLSEALELCESGLREHPAYTTGRLILAKCRAAESRYREALDILRTSSEWIPDSPILLALQGEWEELAAATPGPAEAPAEAPAVGIPAPGEAPAAVTPASDEAPVRINREISEPPPPSSRGAGSSRRAGSSPVISSDSTQTSRSAEAPPPEELASKERLTPVVEGTAGSPPIRRAEIVASGILGTVPSPVVKGSGRPGEEGRIVSKTLAEIYATQGAYGEAILTYRLLKQIRPELVTQIDLRIGELEGLSQVKPPQRG